MNSHFLVVLPFANATASPEQDYLPSALTQSLTSKLSRMEDGSAVISYSTARALPSGSEELQSALRELGARFALRGQIEKANDHVVIEASLIGTSTGQTLWQERYDRPFGELPTIEDEIVAKVAAQTEAKLRDPGRGSSKAIDPGALENLLRAQTLLQAPQSPERLAEARTLLRRALAAEPGFNDAMLRLASIDLAEALAHSTASTTDLLRECEDLLMQILADEPRNDDALSLLGSLRRATNKGSEAVAAFEAAVSANPSNSNALAQLARVKIDVAAASDALPLIERALRLSPLDPQRPLWFTYAGLSLLYCKEPDAARTWLEKAVRAGPRFVTAFVLLAAAQELSGDHESAQATMEMAKKFSGTLSISRVNQQLKPTNPEATAGWQPILNAIGRAGLGH